VHLDRLFARPQRDGDLLVQPASDDPAKDFPLARGQCIQSIGEQTPRGACVALAGDDHGRSIEGGGQSVLVARLLEEVDGAAAQGPHGARDVALTGEEQSRNEHTAIDEGRLKRETVHHGHPKIHEQHVRPPLVE